MNATTLEKPSLSARLKHDTAAEHERMHQLMEQGAPFSGRDRYTRFVAAQYLFQRDVEHLFADPRVQTVVADFDVRGRQSAALLDLADLGATAPVEPLASQGVAMPAALGWLYVSEGSTLGAALLLKEAREKLGLSDTFGARNLAAYPDGRAPTWRRFVASLDEAGYDDAQQDAVIGGALAAFARFGDLLQRQFSLP